MKEACQKSMSHWFLEFEYYKLLKIFYPLVNVILDDQHRSSVLEKITNITTKLVFNCSLFPLRLEMKPEIRGQGNSSPKTYSQFWGTERIFCKTYSDSIKFGVQRNPHINNASSNLFGYFYSIKKRNQIVIILPSQCRSEPYFQCHAQYCPVDPLYYPGKSVSYNII